LVHHRFAWIHPFTNGNGRVVRLVTYAMLIDRGFRGLNIQEGQILNPSAMFCNQRDRYYAMLTRADSGTDEGLLEWCEFVLDGFLSEMTKIDRLLDYDYLVSNVLKPALDYCRERKLITDEEHRVLVIAARKKAFKSADVEDAYPGSSEKRSRFIARLKEKGFLMPLQEGGRIYYLRLRGELLRGIIHSLEKEGFVPFERTQ
jgi:Fic family protein